MGGGREAVTDAPVQAARQPAAPSVEEGFSLDPEEVLAQLQFLQNTLPSAEFANVLRANDFHFQSVLTPFGWHGSRVNDTDYLRDFEKVQAGMSNKVSLIGQPLPKLPKPPPARESKPVPKPEPKQPKLPPELAAPSDAIFDWEQQGDVLTIKQKISREGLHALLVTTADPNPFRIISQRMYRSDDFQNRNWIDVTDEASREGRLNLEWRMPDRRTDKERIRDMEGPGLLYGLFPSFVAPYMRDQTVGIKDPYLRMAAAPGQQAARATTVVTADLLEYAATSVVPELGGAVKGLHAAVTTGAKTVLPAAGTVTKETVKATVRGAKPAVKPVVTAAAAEAVPSVAQATSKVAKPAGQGFFKRNLTKILASAKLGLSNADEVAMRTGASAMPRTAVAAKVEKAGAAAAAKPAAQVTQSAAKPVATTSQAAARPATATVATVTGSARPTAGQALVGSSRSQMRRAAQRLIASVANHPLRFLLNASGRFHRQQGMTEHHNLADHPELVQMGHIESDKLGGPERLMLQGAWENQLNNVSIEGPRVGGAVISQEAISIGGIAVDRRTAQFWEDIGWLTKGTVANSPRVVP